MKIQPKVDCTNDYQMVEEGLRQPPLKINRNVFTKTDEEKAQLKILKAKFKHKL